MAKLVSTEPIVYLPKWNAELSIYEDYEPFQARRPANYHVCNCQNKKAYFQNMSEHKTHIKNKGHKLWVQTFEGNHTHEEFKTLTSELVQIKKELAIAYGNLEKQTARAGRYKLKYDALKNKDGYNCELD
jgi:hypothetical protein